MIPSPSLPLLPPLPVLSPAPPPSPIRSLGYRATMIRMRAKVASTSHSLPLSPPFILPPTRPDALPLGIPPPLPISVPTSSPPLLLPSTSRREDRPEVTLPPRKRLAIALSPGFKGKIIMIRIEGETSIVWSTQHVFKDRPNHHACTSRHMERARKSREAWDEIMDASDLCSNVMSLSTTRSEADQRKNYRDEEVEAVDIPYRTDHSINMDSLAILQDSIDPGGLTAKQPEEAALMQTEGDDSHFGNCRMETVFRISNCSVENQVKFSTCTLLAGALTWWNSHVMTVSHDAAYAMTWADLRKKMTDKYCLRNEMKKLEAELWNLKVKGTDVIGYNQYF
ncbi:hypothetical protein Tco_0988087 [Tanacetum coccineum]|uniref:Retrotransposon gag domain-containing protein n=1 Tax=Tanacetum coccineum TaxID=301880 RepID=A0ABQ5EQE8_9ASTR